MFIQIVNCFVVIGNDTQMYPLMTQIQVMTIRSLKNNDQFIVKRLDHQNEKQQNKFWAKAVDLVIVFKSKCNRPWD